jgi:hypothetical protein
LPLIFAFDATWLKTTLKEIRFLALHWIYRGPKNKEKRNMAES